MRPNFALTLTFETIGLLRRTARGWMPVGEVPTDSPDLDDMLSYLRSKALGLSPQGFTTKLVLPDSEILYTDVTVDGPRNERHTQVRRALDGMTPYAVEELVFDIQGDGPDLRVAVVARETLEQAEAFAIQHRMNPVCFVAAPAQDRFPGEPFFGPTVAAPGLIAPGEKVQRDKTPVIVTPVIVAEREPEAVPDQKPPATPVSETSPPTPAADANDGPVASDMQNAGEPEPEALPKAPDPAPEPAVAKAAAPPAAQPTVAGAPPPGEPAQDVPPRDATDAVAPPPEPAAAEPAAPAPAAPEPAGSDPVVKPQLPVADIAAATPPADQIPDPQVPAPQQPALPAKVADAAPVEPPKVETPKVEAPVIPTANTAPPRPPPSPPIRPPQAEPVARQAATLAPEPPLKITTAGPAPSPAPVPAPPVHAARANTGGANNGAASEAPFGPPPDLGTPVVDATSEAPAPAPIPAFSSRRNNAVVAPSIAVTGSAASLPALGPASQAAPPPIGARQIARPDITPRADAKAPQTRAPLAEPVPAPAPSPRTAKPVGPPNKPRALVTSVISPDLPGKRVLARPQPKGAPPAAKDAATAKPGNSIGKGRGLDRPRGKPRYLGLVLTVVLLVFLAIVAAWSSIYLSRNDGGEVADTRIAMPAPARETDADLALPEAPAPLEIAAGEAVPSPPEPGPVGVPDQVTADMTEPDDPPPAESAADMAASEAAEPAEDLPTPPPPALAAAGADSGETAGGRSPNASPQPEIFLPSRDAAPPSFDAMALPRLTAAADAPPGAPMPPPPAGTVYSFDPDGRIAAGPRGIVTPEGVWLIAARPPVIPPARPAEAAEEPAAETTTPASTEPGSETPAPTADAPATDTLASDALFQPDSAITRRRPQQRPALPDSPAPVAAPVEAAPADADAAAQAEDDAALVAPTDPRFASLRPRARTAEVLSQGEIARRAAEAASLAASAAATAAESAAAAAFVSASPLAVPISRRPAARPQDFSRAVAVAVAEATRATPAAAASTAIPRATPEEEEDDEPELVAAPRAAPSIPTRADVARQATFTNAINLSRTNLIGIYGSASNRHALIRTSNGRYTKVKVGDRVDGGTVAAITSNEVRYQKGGRMLSLSMPRG